MIQRQISTIFRHYDSSSRAANRTVLNYCQMLLGREVTPGLIIARHTFGEGARFHPHLHAITTGGGWDTHHKRIVAFITDPMVVDKILRYLKWKPGQPAPTNIRAPPMMAQVAEST